MSPDREAPSMLVELTSGIDALYVSGRANVPFGFLRTLEAARIEAERSERNTSVEVGAMEFAVSARAWGVHRYCLTHRNGRVGVSPSDQLPALRIQPKAEFLHGAGPGEAISWFRDQLERECGAIELTASRMDVFADFQGWELSVEDRDRFVCRARRVVTYEDDGVMTGLQFGQRKSKTLSARIYDKTIEMRRSGAGYWEEIWGPTYRRGETVRRVEFEIGRQGLSAFGIRSPEEAIAAAGSLWMYATEWLSLRMPTEDGTRARWPVAAEWDQVRRARLTEGANGVERMQAGRARGSLERLEATLVGYLASYAAWSGTRDIEDTCELIPYLLRANGFHSGVHFDQKVYRRRRDLGLL
jgi:hypothetical protein